MQGLPYPQLILERLGFFPLQVLVCSCLSQEMFHFPSRLLTRF